MQPKTIRPLKQTQHGYVYGIEGETEHICIPFSKIEWFLEQLLYISTQQDSEALCSMNFDYPHGLDIFYAENYPPETELDHKALKHMKRQRQMRKRVKERREHELQTLSPLR